MQSLDKYLTMQLNTYCKGKEILEMEEIPNDVIELNLESLGLENLKNLKKMDSLLILNLNENKLTDDCL
jgi:hypothetical protein